ADLGVFSAFGMTVADVLKDRSTSMLIDAERADVARLSEPYARLEEACRRDLEEEGIETARMELTRTLDARYRGQSYEINLPFTATAEGWLEEFHARHHRLYGYSRRDRAVEVVTLRVRGAGKVPPPAPRPRPDTGTLE